MATRGYNTYRGRSSVGKTLLVVGLILVLLAGAAFLYCQNYLVYDDNGHVRLELPWFKSEDSQADEETPISPDDVEITREEPVRLPITPLQAKELAFGRMEQDISDLLQEKALVVNVKRYDGAIGYDTAVETTSSQGSAVALNNLKALLAGKGYAVARISCLADTSYSHAQPEKAGLLRDDKGDVWYDIDGECWLDPTKADTLNYTTQLCRECAELGFDEILLDNFSYPTTGNTDRIFYGEGTDKIAVLSSFAQKLREALPEGTVLSVVLHQPIGSDNGLSGQNAELLTQFDRIYTDASVDATALTAQLPQDYVVDGRIVPMVSVAPTAGSFLLMVQ